VKLVGQILKTFVLAGALALGTVSGSHAQDREGAEAQATFGIAVAQRGLWQEAIYRWERAVQLDPDYAPAWNNLGIAHEQAGSFDKALKAYEKALDLDPDNPIIQQNYDLFREINDRIQISR
jgi:Flp pilus assembly protein TadD